MTKTIDKINELKDFYHNILKYSSLMKLNFKDKLTNKQKSQMAELFEIIGRQVGHYGKLITELTGIEKVDVHGKEYDMWVIALKMPQDRLAYSALVGQCIQITNRAIGQLEEDIRTGLRDKQGKVIEKPYLIGTEPLKAFIAHGGDSPALAKLKSFLDALGVQPLIVEEQPSEGRSIAINVDYYARQSDFAIILATKGDVDGKTGGFIPRGNVLMEIGKLQELLKDRIVYLVQAGTKLPTNISEKVRVRFSPQSMDNSFIKIAKELRNWGFLITGKVEE